MPDEFHVVFPLYPGVTQLDFTGPLEVFQRLPRARCTLASVAGGELGVEGGMTLARLVPLFAVDSCALLCVPGGYGTVSALADTEYLKQVRRLGMGARYVTSVCTGSLLLAAAGLLKGRRAASHWAWRELLTLFDVLPDAGRVVRDGSVITGGGVTAGIDMALAVTAEIAGADYAQSVQLAIEYAPQPPFDCGRPELARPEILAAVKARLDARGGARDAAVRRAAKLVPP